MLSTCSEGVKGTVTSGKELLPFEKVHHDRKASRQERAEESEPRTTRRKGR